VTCWEASHICKCTSKIWKVHSPCEFISEHKNGYFGVLDITTSSSISLAQNVIRTIRKMVLETTKDSCHFPQIIWTLVHKRLKQDQHSPPSVNSALCFTASLSTQRSLCTPKSSQLDPSHKHHFSFYSSVNSESPSPTTESQIQKVIWGFKPSSRWYIFSLVFMKRLQNFGRHFKKVSDMNLQRHTSRWLQPILIRSHNCTVVGSHCQRRRYTAKPPFKILDFVQ